MGLVPVDLFSGGWIVVDGDAIVVDGAHPSDTLSMTSQIEYSTQTPKKSTLFSGLYLHNH